MKKPKIKNYKLAEFTGILLGDGCIGQYRCGRGDQTSVQRYVKVTLSGDEVEFADYVESLYQELFDIKPNKRYKNNENAVEIRSFKKNLFKFVNENLGLKKAPKWGRADIPKQYIGNKLERDVLRGYFDTDGSVVITDNNGTVYPRLEMKVCPSPMQSKLLTILDNQGFNFGSYDIGDGMIRVQLNGKSTLGEWLEVIGFSNRKHIRKAKKVL